MTEAEWRAQPGPWAHLTQEQTNELLAAECAPFKLRIAELEAERDAAFAAGLENAAEIAELARDPSSIPRILREKAAHLRAMASKGA